MNWKDKLETFHRGDRKEFRDETLVVSHILKGLGYKSNKLHYLCKMLGISYEDASDFSAVRSVLDHVSGGMFHASSPNRKFVVDTRPPTKSGLCWADDNELSGLCHVAKSVKGGLIIFCRSVSTSGSPTSNAFVFTKDTPEPEPYLLRPISILRTVKDGVAVWVRKTSPLIRDMAECLKWDIPEAE